MNKIILLIAFFVFPLSLLAQEYDDWGLDSLNTAANADYLSDDEKAVVLEMNKVRTNPKRYAEEYIKPMLNLYNGKILTYPGEIGLITNEGKRAAEECYKALLKQKPVGVLYPSEGMSAGARDHVNDQAETGRTGHAGSDRSMPDKRVNRYGKWGVTVGENLFYGTHNATRIVVSLLIDDGVKDRGHRKAILSPAFRITGVAIGTHKKYDYMCAIEYAGTYTEATKP